MFGTLVDTVRVLGTINSELEDFQCIWGYHDLCEEPSLVNWTCVQCIGIS